MSTWGIGDSHDTDEVQTLKETLRSKDAQLATLGGQLMKRDDDNKGFQSALNDVVEKLRRESDRVLELDAALHKRNEELQNERLTRQNIELTLHAIQQKFAGSERSLQELQSAFDAVSSQSDHMEAEQLKTQTENTTLQRRILDLQQALAAKEQSEQILLRESRSSAASATSNRNRQRSSSITKMHIASLEQEVSDANTRMVKHATELSDARDRLARAQEAVVRLENEKMAMEKQWMRRVQEMETKLGEHEDDLRALRQSGGADAAAREESLLERLNDEERRVMALESELSRSSTSHERELSLVRAELERTQRILEEEYLRTQTAEGRLIDLVGEKEEALDELDRTREQAQQLQREFELATKRLGDLETMQAHSISGLQATTQSPGPDAETAAAVERLLGAIERLRGERDQLRRDLEFLTIEHQFSVEHLNLKLAAAIACPASPALDMGGQEQPAAHCPTPARQEAADGRSICGQKAAMVLALVVQHVHAEQQEGFLRMEDLEEELAHVQSLLQEARRELEVNEVHKHQTHAIQEHTDAYVGQLQAMLDDSTRTLQQAQSQISVLDDSIERLQAESLREREAHDDLGVAFAQTERQLSEGMQALASVEEQKDALALQLRHAQQDLERTRNELTEADTRHQRQLCAMSSGESTRALLDQIATLKDRVERRTEQIGIHQHDIKRLETNLRIQEDRISEMALEIETMLGEKEVMVEDCRTTRETRNETLQRCEILEEKNEHLEEETERLALALTSVSERETNLMNEVQALSNRLLDEEARRENLELSLLQVGADNARLIDETSHLEAKREHLTQSLEERGRLLHDLKVERDLAANDSIQLSVALATFHIALQAAQSSSTHAQHCSRSFQVQVINLQQEIQTRLNVIATLEQQVKDFQSQQTVNAVAVTQLTDRHVEELHELSRVNDALRTQLEENARNLLAEEACRMELRAMQARHGSEMEDLQRQLRRIEGELDLARRQCADAVESRQQARDALNSMKAEFETQLAEATAKLQSKDVTEDEMALLQSRHAAELEILREQLSVASSDLEDRQKAYEELSIKSHQLSENMEVLVAQIAEKAENCQRAEAQMTQLRSDLAQEKQSFQNQIEAITTELRLARETAGELTAQCQQHIRDSSSREQDLKSQLVSSLEEVEYLKATLQGEMDLHTRSQKNHEVELQTTREKVTASERSRECLEKDLEDLHAQLADMNTHLEGVSAEKTSLQYDKTNMEAEIQRLKSLQRFLESQTRDSELQLVSLKEDLEKVRVDSIRFEKDCKSAEAALSMREIQHEQTLASLRRELNALRADPKLEDRLTELQERNLEMEELLKSKCLEIEENDDRFIEMLKEKKKLTSKVESLTRKVHNLQGKLAATGESNATVPETGASATPHHDTSDANTSRVDALSNLKTRMPSGSVPAALSIPAPLPNVSKTQSRVVSGSAVLPRPKTPERRTTHQTVFRARTPEHSRASSSTAPIPAMPVAVALPSSSSLGKKRRAPDDFEDCESVPPQGFTIDSVPSVETTTPRARRTLHAIRTGFTPVRSYASNQEASQLSPTRTTKGAPLDSTIADVTNSPRAASRTDSTKATKRGWLGKIRSAPVQPLAGRSVSKPERR
ncbi:uncharacterized protein FIBRA_05889 [Fibroporia radiculosa]|uniref:Uncharacterized protein n=1 Tax=Fibroporia radiculosa TaxID=599839 RepID=J4GAA5_9APHY|nr:uncharacterized protein FIBRA_05889 [Fibroporia radiculosa]CCM03743.1 predicted protein [Fibroporia radiculosa]